MDNNYPLVTIGCPIRDREIYLPSYLDCIKNLDYPLENITLLFVENDSTDNTLSILNNFKNENNNLFYRIKILNYNQGTPKDERNIQVREQYTYSALSKLRNFWMSQIKTPYALSCDSDIMMPSHILKQLLSHKVDYVASLIINGYEYKPESPWEYTNMLTMTPQGYKHINKYPEDTLIEVGFTGAIMLLSQRACKSAKFSLSPLGEDQKFCEELHSKGIKTYVDTGAKCTHCMNKEYLELYRKGEFIFN